MPNHLKHGESGKHMVGSTAEYRAWLGMKARCYLTTRKDFASYGGRGITVCDRWLGSFEAFLSDVGRKPTPSHSLDRYPDVNGNYEPSNVRWATPTEQANNRRPANRRNRARKLDGNKTALDISLESGVAKSTVLDRYRRGYRGADLYAPSLEAQRLAGVGARSAKMFAAMSPQERSERARKAAQVRWSTL